MATLYRKYRPQTFNEVVGQNHIRITLEYQIKSGQMAHAFLFCGPRAVGKTTLARVMAKSLNCLNRPENQAEPCNICSACIEISEGRAMDIIEIDGASNNGIDNVRDNIIAGAHISPVSMKHKIFIIDEIHMLSTQAFNALLKTLEEPPQKVIFIFCTTEAHKIPTTIISRCQRFDFKRISVLDIVHKLEYILSQEKIRADKEVLENIARYSGGHMRDAESALGQILALADNPEEGQLLFITKEQAELVIPKNDLEQALKLIEFLTIKDAANAIRLINLMVDDGFDLKTFTSDMIELMRQMMLIKVSPELIPSIGLEIGESLSSKMIALLDRVSLNWLLKSLERLLDARANLKEALLTQLPIEMAIVEITEIPLPEHSQPTSMPSKQAIQATAPATSRSDDSLLDLAEIEARWPEFLANIKKANHSLSFTMMTSKPKSLANNALLLTFKHKIHKDRLSEPQINQIVEKVLEEVYNAKLKVTGELEEISVNDNTAPAGPYSASNNSSDPAIDEVLKALGGKIIG